MGTRPPRPHARGHGAPRRLTGITRSISPLAVTSAIAWLFPAAFFLLGLAMILITLRARTARRRFEETAAQAPGEVTDMRWESVGQAGDRSMLAFPIVRFSLPDGRTVETRTRSGSNPPPAKQGTQVTVFYDPANPTDAAVPGGTVTTIVSAGLIGIGGVFMVIALAFAAFLSVVL